MSLSNSWKTVSKSKPCPICRKPDNCNLSSDGKWCYCGRVQEGSVKVNAGGQFLHLLQDDRNQWRGCNPMQNYKPKLPHWEPRPDFHQPAKEFFHAQQADEARRELAKMLHVSVESLEAIGVGWDSLERCWTFPEKNAYGSVIGYTRRYPTGGKYQAKGSQRGLTFASDWNKGGDLFLVEGGSDTAALLTIGLSVIGRPSNLAGVDLLTSMLDDFDLDRRIIVIGERDEKPDGKFPGRDGAISTSQRLAESLMRPILWSFPPGEFKDSREWLTSVTHSYLVFADDQAKRKLFIKGLQLNYVMPDADLQDMFDERAGIHEHDGQMTRSEAENLAYEHVIQWVSTILIAK